MTPPPGCSCPTTGKSASLRGATVDVVDLYGFSLSRRSAVDLTLRQHGSTTMTLVVLTDTGRRLATGTNDISRRLDPGRYFAAVRTRNNANGRYTLRRVSRTITRTSISIDGDRSAEAPPGRTVRIDASLAPGASGPVTSPSSALTPWPAGNPPRESNNGPQLTRGPRSYRRSPDVGARASASRVRARSRQASHGPRRCSWRAARALIAEQPTRDDPIHAARLRPGAALLLPCRFA